MEGTSFRAVDPDDSDSVERDLAGSTAADSGHAADSVADAPETAPELASLTESDVEIQLAETLRATTGLVVVLGSAQNIDRLVTVYRATLRADRDLVVDLYTADIGAATGRPSIPAIGQEWPRVHVYAPLRGRNAVVMRSFTRRDMASHQASTPDRATSE